MLGFVGWFGSELLVWLFNIQASIALSWKLLMFGAPRGCLACDPPDGAGGGTPYRMLGILPSASEHFQDGKAEVLT